MFEDSEDDLVDNVINLRNKLRVTENNLQTLGDQLSESHSSVRDGAAATLSIADLQALDAGPSSELSRAHSSYKMSEHMSCVSTLHSDSRPSSAKETDVENNRLRRMLNTIREENSALVLENRQLVKELEGMHFELASFKTKVRLLSSTVGSKESSIMRMKEQILNLESVVESHDTSVRLMEKLKEDLRISRAELAERSSQVERTEQQRNEALYNAEKLSVAFREYKGNATEKLKAVLGNENKLKESLILCHNEKEQLESRCTILEKEKNHLEEQMKAEMARLEAEMSSLHHSEDKGAGHASPSVAPTFSSPSNSTVPSQRAPAPKGEGYKKVFSMLQTLKQKTSQQDGAVSELQGKLKQAKEEMDNMAQRTECLEKEVKKKTSQLAGLEKQLEEKTSECTAAVYKSTELQQELQEKNGSVQYLQGIATKQQKEFQQTLQKTKDASLTKRKELQDQMELLRHSLDQKQSQVMELERLLSVSSQEAKQHEESLGTYKQQAAESYAKVRSLEGVLSSCREELNMYLHQIEETKLQYESQLKTKSGEASNQERELRKVRGELSSMEGELLQLRRDSNAKTSLLNQMEGKLQETQGLLEKKTELDLEEKLHRSEMDRRNSLQRAQQLEEHLQTVRDELANARGHLQELQDMLKHSQHIAGEREAAVERLSAELRESQKELEERNLELLDMDSSLKERQGELQQRAAQLSQLNIAIQESKANMDKKIVHLEESLERTERELKERVNQVEFMRERLELMKMQLQGREALEKDNQEQGQQLRLCREQLRLSREQLHRAAQDQHEVQRRCEHLTTELEEASRLLQDKELQVKRQNEELSEMETKATEAKARLQTHVKSLQMEMEVQRDEHRAELSAMQQSRTQLLRVSDHMSHSLRASQEQLEEQKRRANFQLEEARNEVANLQAELRTQEEVLQRANEALLSKATELAHLKAKLPGYAKSETSTSPSHHRPWVDTSSAILSCNLNDSLRSTLQLPDRSGHNSTCSSVQSFNPLLYEANDESRSESSAVDLFNGVMQYVRDTMTVQKKAEDK